MPLRPFQHRVRDSGALQEVAYHLIGALVIFTTEIVNAGRSIKHLFQICYDFPHIRDTAVIPKPGILHAVLTVQHVKSRESDSHVPFLPGSQQRTSSLTEVPPYPDVPEWPPLPHGLSVFRKH